MAGKNSKKKKQIKNIGRVKTTKPKISMGQIFLAALAIILILSMVISAISKL